MPSPPEPKGLPSPEGRGVSGSGPSLRPDPGARAARAAEIPTKATSAPQSRQRRGKPRLHPLLARPDEAGLDPSPNGAPQRAQTMRPARLRSAFTAQLPQLGQAIAPRTLESSTMLTPANRYTCTSASRCQQMAISDVPRPASGFPSPADDYGEGRIDLNRELIPSPLSTFFMRVRGDAMRDEGILDGDLLVIDRSLNPRVGCVVVAVFEGKFIVRRLCAQSNRPQALQLETRDGTYSPIALNDDRQQEGAELWGVVTHAVHHLRRQANGRMGP
jgi:DNA polymerase V